MAKSAYIGVSSKAKKVKKIYIGQNGVAKRVKKAYIGVGGKAKLFYSSSLDTNKALVIANNGASTNLNVYELNTDTGVMTLKNSSYSTSNLKYSGIIYDDVNYFFKSRDKITYDMGTTFVQGGGTFFIAVQLIYKGKQLRLWIQSTSDQYYVSGIYLEVDGTSYRLGQYTFTSGADAGNLCMMPISDHEVLCMELEYWTWPSTHRNYQSHFWLFDLSNNTSKMMYVPSNPFGYFSEMYIAPDQVDISNGTFVVRYRDTHQNATSEAQLTKIGLAYIDRTSSNYYIKPVDGSTPITTSTYLTYSSSETPIILGVSGARTDDSIICRTYPTDATYYVSRDNGKTWTLVNVPSITQGNRFNKILATGEKFLATIGIQNGTPVRANGIVKSTDGVTWTLVCEIPNRAGTSSYDSYTGMGLPILIGTYYKYQA